MKIAFFAYIDPEEGPPGRYAGHCRFREDSKYVGFDGCVVIDVADFKKWNDAKRHAYYLADFDDSGILEEDENLVFDEVTGDANPEIIKGEAMTIANANLHWAQLTEQQRAFVLGNIERFWEVFVTEDVDMVGSECGCCESKRALFKEVLAVIGPCEACQGHVGPGKRCHACGLEGMPMEQLDALLPPTCAQCHGIHPGQDCPPCGNCQHPAHGDAWCEASVSVYQPRCFCYPGYGKKS